ncbi:MAG: DNA-binding response regulator [Planctomycetota bacterium]|nr:MAG: DNA-binding response regulator [Planctomycetota bacterium]
MDEPEPTVFIVDDDEVIRRSLSLLLETVGIKTETFTSCEEFLNAYDRAKAGSLVLDVRMRGMSGLELQAKLKADRVDIPVVIITGHGDVPMAVKAMQNGAISFIEKPFRDQVLLDNVQKAIELETQVRRERIMRTDIEAKLALLTKREREIMDLLITGKTNKMIAHELGISHKTVDFHRGNVLEKMGVDSVVELLRLTQKLDLPKQN